MGLFQETASGQNQEGRLDCCEVRAGRPRVQRKPAAGAFPIGGQPNALGHDFLVAFFLIRFNLNKQ
jgi:hypothetical protein